MSGRKGGSLEIISFRAFTHTVSRSPGFRFHFFLGDQILMLRVLRIPILLLVLCVLAQPGINTLADISGSSSPVALGTSSQNALWIQCIAPSTNTNAVRFGDSTVSSTRGLPIAPGGGYNTPAMQGRGYSLANTYVYVATGDKLSCAYGW